MFQGTGALAFNAAFYLQTNPDVFQAIQNGTFQGSALDHFVQFGQFEGRDPNAFFDTSYYLENNPDVLVAIADPANPSVTSAFQHFVMFGADEGVVRAPSAAFESFNAETYFAQNPDLQAAFGNLTGEAREDALFAHFLEFGVNENRPGSGVNVDANPGVPGETFAFTTGVDSLTGTANNDTFNGVVTGSAATTTFQAGDTVNGGGGTDRVNLTFTATGAADATTLTNVEQVFARTLAGTATLDATLWDGVDQLWSDRSAVGTTTVYNNVQENATVGLNSLTPTVDAAGVITGVSNTQVNFAAGALKSDGTVAIVSNSSAANVTITSATAAALTGIAITATGDNAIDLAAGTAVKSVTVDGNGSLVLDNLGAGTTLNTVTTVDASANTGGVDVNLAGNAGNVTVTGGSGDDVFRFGGSLTKTDVVNGGAGFDTVVVDGGISFASAAAAAPFNALTGIERVEFVSTGADVTTLNGTTFTNTGITNLLFNTEGADVINNAGAARTYEFGTENDGNATFTMKAGQTELNISLLGETGSEVAIVDDVLVTLPGATAGTVSTINLVSEGALTTAVTGGAEQFGGTTVYNGVGTVTAVAGSVVNITGEGNLDVAGFANRVNVDASGFEGLLVIEGSNITGNTVTPAQFDAATFAESDVFDLGDARTTVEFGSGADSGVFITTGAGTLTEATTFNVDVINNFSAGLGGDVLDFAGVDATFTALTTAQQTAVDAAGSLQAAAAIAANQVTGTSAWTAFEFGGETYALYDAAQVADGGFDAANDILVQLSGVEIADLVTANFA